jgi:hypothetical protein
VIFLGEEPAAIRDWLFFMVRVLLKTITKTPECGLRLYSADDEFLSALSDISTGRFRSGENGLGGYVLSRALLIHFNSLI